MAYFSVDQLHQQFCIHFEKIHVYFLTPIISSTIKPCKQTCCQDKEPNKTVCAEFRFFRLSCMYIDKSTTKLILYHVSYCKNQNLRCALACIRTGYNFYIRWVLGASSDSSLQFLKTGLGKIHKNDSNYIINFIFQSSIHIIISQ